MVGPTVVGVVDVIDENGWSEWKQRVLYQLEAQGKEIHEMRTSVIELKLELAKLQLKAGVWGAVAGLVPGVSALIWYMM